MSFDEITLTRRVFELREASENLSSLTRELCEQLSFTEAEASILAAVLEDRFVSREEQMDLLMTLDLRRTLARDATVGGFIFRLAGLDGQEATRYHARTLAEGLSPAVEDGERRPMAHATLSELAMLLPQEAFSYGLIRPSSHGIYQYLHAQDATLFALASEIRRNWETSTDPILRMRSARVIAATGDPHAIRFLSESTAAFSHRYSGPLSVDECLARAAGLAIDGHEAAIRYLQNIAENPLETVGLRRLALEHLPPQSLEDGSDTAEVFRSLVEDPEEPIATRYLMLSLLARQPHPPNDDWWRGMMRDPTMLVRDRVTSDATENSEKPRGDFSQWHLVLAALGTSRAGFASELLREAIQDRNTPVAIQREALMAYLHRDGRGSLPWESLHAALGLPSGNWDSILEGAATGEHPLRLRFPQDRHAITEYGLGSSETVSGEIVLEIFQRMGRWEVDFRPFHAAQDRRVWFSDPPPYESYLPRNRRVLLGGLSTEEICAEVLPLAPGGLLHFEIPDDDSPPSNDPSSSQDPTPTTTPPQDNSFDSEGV